MDKDSFAQEYIPSNKTKEELEKEIELLEKESEKMTEWSDPDIYLD